MKRMSQEEFDRLPYLGKQTMRVLALSETVIREVLFHEGLVGEEAEAAIDAMTAEERTDLMLRYGLAVTPPEYVLLFPEVFLVGEGGDPINRTVSELRAGLSINEVAEHLKEFPTGRPS